MNGALFRSSLLLPLCLSACYATDEDRAEGPPVIGDGDKSDGETPIEVSARLGSNAPVDGTLSAEVARAGYVLYAEAGSRLVLEVTRAGTGSGVDTLVRLYGPRRSDGSYPAALGSDDDSGWGKLSRLSVEAPAQGFYLVEVTSKSPASSAQRFRLALSCSGAACDSDAPVAPLGADVRWTMRSAEARAARLQAYGQAGERLRALAQAGQLDGDWAVILDCDETVIDNSPYQRARAELGVGYSGPSWIAWVNRRAAAAIPGAPAFLEEVRALGGRVVFVTNRKLDRECEPTKANLDALGMRYDAILCKSDSSDKNPRFAAVEQGTTGTSLPPLEVVMYVGDNILDFPALSQDLRQEDDQAFADFGGRFVILPNPMYGSWEKNGD